MYNDFRQNHYNNNFRQDYYNYKNNNYNQPLYTEDSNASKLYDAYQGFIRGNLFPNLYNSYKVNPIELRPANEQAKMLTTLDALEFAVKDINLYLDIYPEDKDMIELFNQYRREYNHLLEEYQQQFGPITLTSDANQTFPFDWINSPWPWEGGK